MLSENIPECHLNGGKCRHKHRTAPPIGIPVNIVKMLFYIKGVFADKILSDVLNRTYKSLFLIFESSLTHSVDTFICVDLYKHPVGAEAVYGKCLNVCNLHSVILSFYSTIS